MSETATITVRLIKSFPHNNVKNVVMKSLPTSTTIRQLKDQVLESNSIDLYFSQKFDLSF